MPETVRPLLTSEGDLAVLSRLVEGTVRSTGAEFLHNLVRNLSLALDATHALVAEFADSKARVRTLAFWGNGVLLPDVEYDLSGTPCEDVARGELCHYPSGVQQRFPKDQGLVDMGAESYIGVPLLDGTNEILGHLAVFDVAPSRDDMRRLAILQIFAARAAAELERLRAEQLLRASERRFRDLYEEAPIAYVYEDTETRFVSANRAAINLLGLKPEEVVGTVGRDLLAPTELAHQRVDDAFRDLKQGKAHGQIEFELRRKDDGRPVWVQFWSKPDPDGKFTRTMIIDITARVLAEQDRERLQQQNRYLQEEIKSAYNFEEIIGDSPALRATLEKVRHVAPTDSTVLILGETGTGKELVARAIHNISERRERPLIKVNCAALPTGLIESELFGHEKGAFTGATQKRVGRFALADRGTIFLDEIGELPPEVQIQAAARAPGARVRARRLLEDRQGGRAGHRRHQPESRKGRRGRLVPRRSVLSAARVSDSHAAAARAPRGSPDAHALFHGEIRERGSVAVWMRSRRRRGNGCSRIHGRATCASSRTSSSGR